LLDLLPWKRNEQLPAEPKKKIWPAHTGHSDRNRITSKSAAPSNLDTIDIETTPKPITNI
jgi:hypothetical protein